MLDKNYENIERNMLTKTAFERLLTEKFLASSETFKQKYFFTANELNYGHVFRVKYPLVFDGLFKKWIENGDFKIHEVL